MTIRLLVGGTLISHPIERMTSKDNAYVTFSLHAGDRNADALVNCVAFDPDAVREILAARKGDALTVAGKGEIKSWTTKDGAEKHGLNCTVDRVLTIEMSK